ncbi:MAG: metallophosphoesterase family protein [Simkaniaceae bacterium]|nr:metallophosphoesterase family protein [Simkaniaceae bacterium]
MRLLFSILFFCASLQAEDPKIRHVYLTWQGDTSTTMTINVHTLGGLEEIDVCYTEEKKANQEPYKHHIRAKGIPFACGDHMRHLFHIELTNLSAGGTYCFTLGTKKTGFIEELKFKTIHPKNSSYRFITGGDCEVNSTAIALMKQASACNPDALFLGGDYPTGVESLADYGKWDEWLDMYTNNMTAIDGTLIPMIVAIGNHEAFGGFNQLPEKAPFYYNYFKQNERDSSYFSKTFGEDIVLFVLDSGHTASYGGSQLDWMKQEFQKHESKKIKLAIYHVPIYPSVRFPKPTVPYHIISKIMELNGYKYFTRAILLPQSDKGGKYWLPLFDKYQLTAAFEHHDQTLKRTKQLFNGKEHPNGTLYLGDGGWGPELQCTPIQYYFNSFFAKTIGHVSFFWLVDINKNSIHYRALTPTGTTIDEYYQNISKQEK